MISQLKNKHYQVNLKAQANTAFHEHPLKFSSEKQLKDPLLIQGSGTQKFLKLRKCTLVALATGAIHMR